MITPKEVFDNLQRSFPNIVKITKHNNSISTLIVLKSGRNVAVYNSDINIDWQGTTQYPLPEKTWRLPTKTEAVTSNFHCRFKLMFDHEYHYGVLVGTWTPTTQNNRSTRWMVECSDGYILTVENCEMEVEES